MYLRLYYFSINNPNSYFLIQLYIFLLFNPLAWKLSSPRPSLRCYIQKPRSPYFGSLPNVWRKEKCKARCHREAYCWRAYDASRTRNDRGSSRAVPTEFIRVTLEKKKRLPSCNLRRAISRSSRFRVVTVFYSAVLDPAFRDRRRVVDAEQKRMQDERLLTLARTARFAEFTRILFFLFHENYLP